MFTDNYIFHITIPVRDYEVDVEGIVNNAEYLHYMEHTRHEFCKKAGCSFRDMHASGIDPVVSSIEVKYRHPLTMGDNMVSCLNLRRQGPAFVFDQDIFLPDGTPVTQATVKIVTLVDGHLTRGDELAEAFTKYL